MPSAEMLVIEVRDTESGLYTIACPKTGGNDGLSCRPTEQTHRRLMAQLQAHCTDAQETDGSMNSSHEF